MKKKLIFISLFSALGSAAFSQISGTVYRDFNANGTRDVSATFNEVGVPNIVVNAYDASNASVASATTASDGTYSLAVANGTAVRVEFTGFPNQDYDGLVGASSNSSIRFVTAPLSNLDLGVNYPKHYSQPNPTIIAPRLTNGEVGTAPASTPGLMNLSYTDNSDWNTGALTSYLVNYNDLGNVWGVAYNRQQQEIYMAAFLKRHAGLKDHNADGTGDLGAIYQTTTSGGTPTLLVDVTTLGIDVGQAAMPSEATRALGSISNPNTDPLTFDMIGKYGIGDMDMSADNKTLYFVNIYNKTLYALDVSGASPTVVGTYPIPSPCNETTQGVMRPFSVKYYRGDVYVGVICDANIIKDINYLTATVYKMNSSGAFTSVLSFPLNFTRDCAVNTGGSCYVDTWDYWFNTFLPNGDPGLPDGAYGNTHQPIFSAIEFDVNGDMIMAFADRMGIQMSFEQLTPDGNQENPITAGDLMRAALLPSGLYQLESDGTCGGVTTNGQLDPQGPGGGEYYYSDVKGENFGNFNMTGNYRWAEQWSNNPNQDAYHAETASGSTVLYAGSGEVLATVMDPFGFISGGVSWFNNTTGQVSKARTLFATYVPPGDPANGTAGKGVGLSDIELLSDASPVVIGNRVWEDLDGDGVQDAGEPGFAGVPVELRDNTNALVATATTDANGNYYFSNVSGASTGSYIKGLTLTYGSTYSLVYPTTRTGVTGAYSGVTLPIVAADADGTSNGDARDSDPAVATGVKTFMIGGAGQNNYSFDAGYGQPVVQCLGNYVWLDADQDGVQDASERGVSGVTVTLYDGTTVIGTMKTDAFGAYQFCGIPVSAAYTVKFSLPADYVFTSKGTGVPSTDSDPDPSTGITDVFSVTSGQIRDDIDAGIYFQPKTTACLGDYVWVDDNQNGAQDATEVGVEGIVVNLLDNGGNVITSTVTNNAGYYQFCDLTPAVYSVNFVLPVGYQFTTANATSDDMDSDASITLGAGFGNTATVSLFPGDFNRTLDAGIYPTTTTTASVGDLVWYDLNQNGIQDSGEPGVKNVTVQLFDAGNTLINTLKTDAFGNYLFTNVAPGCYYVVFNAPAGYTYSTAAQGGNIYLDSDPTIIAGTQGTTPNFCVVNGDRLVNIDAGIYQSSPAGTARLGNYVWYDVDQDGLQDASETGVPGVTVVLLDNTSSEIARTTTDRDGLYQFTNLAAGTYSVAFSNLPSGYTFTSTTQGTATGSDANRATGETQQVTLAVGDSHQDLDAGIIITDGNSGKASLGNYVWNDLNSNGQQDAGEPGVGNVFVELLDESSVQIATVYTDALGYYIFNGLDAGRYYVRFNAPSGYNFTTQNSGADATDSDANTGTGVTGQYILAIGETNLTVDAGLVSTSGNTASLGNYVWIDSNSDGIQNETNTGIGGICVSLENAGGTVLVTTTTDNTGFYLFPNLAAGSYRVNFGCLPAGYTFTTKNAGGSTTSNDSDAGTEGSSDLVTLLAGEQNLTVDAGIISTTVAAVGNYVWLDANQDGQQGSGESPVAGVTATLYNAGTNAVIASAITDSRGEYYFYNVDASLTYYVIFSNIPEGTKFTTQNSGADASDSDANTSGRTDNFTVAAGGTNFTIDAGLITPCASSLSGYTWVDVNTDGQQSAGERPVSGITVTLSQGGVAILKSITDAKGWYHFNGVPAGTYDVTFGTIALGSTFTVQNTGPDATDSDSDGAGNAGSVVLSCAALRGPDAGFTPTGVLPVNVLSFTGKLQGEDGILNWVTTAEINLSGFEISRSFDGQLFERIATVAAKGNATNTTSYEMTDKNVAFSGANKVYYRLTGKDLDGTESSQNLVELNLRGNKAMFAELYPNPVTTTLFLSYQVEATTQVEVVNMLGETVYNGSLEATTAVQTLSIDTQNWSNGIYFVRLSNKSSVKTMKVVK